MPLVEIFGSKGEADQVLTYNTIRKVRLGNMTLCLVRTSKGYFAFDHQCPHMSDDLGKAKINPQNEVVCQWHAYRFDLLSGEESENRCGELKTYPLVWDDGCLKIEI